MASTIDPPSDPPEQNTEGTENTDDSVGHDPEAQQAADDHGSKRPTRRVLLGVAVVGAVLVAALAITGMTGLDAPGPAKRYKYEQLRELADLINTQAGDIRTPDDCWRTLTGASGPLREIAKVDYLRSRVVVRLYSRQLGKIDASVRNLSNRSMDALLDAYPEMSRKMIATEASPDGWSPNLTCRITSGSRIAGF